MPKDFPEMNIRTTIVSGDYDSFKAALTRSIIGVTFKKFKRLGARFYATKAENMAIVDAVCKRFYEELQRSLPEVPLKYLRIATTVQIKWDRDGRIVDLSNVNVSVYQFIGDLAIKAANVQRRSMKVKVDFFYSSVDFQSQSIRKELDSIEQEVGKDYFERTDHDFLDQGERKIAERMQVRAVPTVVLNDSVVLDNPTKTGIGAKITELLAPYVNATDTKFTFEVTLDPIQKMLAALPKR